MLFVSAEQPSIKYNTFSLASSQHQLMCSMQGMQYSSLFCCINWWCIYCAVQKAQIQRGHLVKSHVFQVCSFFMGICLMSGSAELHGVACAMRMTVFSSLESEAVFVDVYILTQWDSCIKVFFVHKWNLCSCNFFMKGKYFFLLLVF